MEKVAVLLLLIAVITGSTAFKCYSGMTQNGAAVPGMPITSEDCFSGNECADVNYTMSMFGANIKVKQAMCVYFGGSCTQICGQITGANKDIKDCKASCCDKELCNDAITKTSVPSIKCYEGMTQNGNPVPGMPVTSKDCPSGECANIHYSMSMFGVSMKVNQAMCTSGVACGGLCGTVTSYNEDVKDCKATCCSKDLCNVVTK